jgi:hypothetical protein
LKIAEISEAISNLGKSSLEKQTIISMGEAYHIWKTLVSRYDALNMTNIFANFSKDPDLKLIIDDGLDVLNYELQELESLMKEYAIPMPDKPPEKANIASDVNAITDKTIYRFIHEGIKNTNEMYVHYFNESPSSTIREIFLTFLKKELELYDKFIEYGKLKGYIHESPSFRAL